MKNSRVTTFIWVVLQSQLAVASIDFII